MKKTLVLASLLCLVLLGACSMNTEKDKQDKPSKSAESVTKKATTNTAADTKATKSIVVNGMEITVEQNKTSQIKKGKTVKDLYSFKIRGKNVSPVKAGLGAIDFVLKTKSGKTITVDDSLATFGNEIQKNKTLKGEAYFSVASGLQVESIAYKPANKELATWKVSK